MASDNRETDRPEAQPDQPKMPKPVFESGPYESQQSAHEAARKAVAAEFAKLDRPPRPGDRDFDPGEHHGELGDAFRPGCHDPQGRFSDKERSTAERLAENGAGVYPRLRDDTTPDKKNPDAMIRTSPEDSGIVTEFKKPNRPNSRNVQRGIIEAGAQVAQYGGGDAVVDGRDVGLTAEDARRGYARAFGQAREHGQTMPERVTVIIGDGSILMFGKV